MEGCWQDAVLDPGGDSIADVLDVLDGPIEPAQVFVGLHAIVVCLPAEKQKPRVSGILCPALKRLDLIGWLERRDGQQVGIRVSSVNEFWRKSAPVRWL